MPLIKRSSIAIQLERIELELANRLRFHRFEKGGTNPLSLEFGAHVQLIKPRHTVSGNVCSHADDAVIVHGNGNVA
ncbi:hypothetical protein BLA6860_00327 [Burkholderia lata]|nr:hypothetical protein BLA6860_00327 [Burkholderia lata]